MAYPRRKLAIDYFISNHGEACPQFLEAWQVTFLDELDWDRCVLTCPCGEEVIADRESLASQQTKWDATHRRMLTVFEDTKRGKIWKQIDHECQSIMGWIITTGGADGKGYIGTDGEVHDYMEHAKPGETWRMGRFRYAAGKIEEKLGKVDAAKATIEAVYGSKLGEVAPILYGPSEED